MRIAQVAPLIEAVPPKLYGGTERVVSYLTEELVRLGHDVTLFASGDSRTAARLVAGVPEALRLAGVHAAEPYHMLLADRAFALADQFDVIHFHIDYLHLPLAEREQVPTVTTMHGRLDLPEVGAIFRRYFDAPLVSISDAQREPLPFANWVGTVYHGLPKDLHPFNERSDGYLAFLGRISPEKGVDRAIEIARRAGIPLKIAAKVDRADREYFETQIARLLDQPGIEYVGEIGDGDKGRFLGNAIGLLFPVDWPEPFGLVMIEAMACGTPVVAFRRGSVPEVIDEGVTGFVVENIDEAVRAVGRLDQLDRRTCRTVFEKRFSAERMAREYVEIYKRLIARDRRTTLAA
ncbi:MAG TPA: glycosyltransferase family 4 protein [Candidatus Binatia bacterium]